MEDPACDAASAGCSTGGIVASPVVSAIRAAGTISRLIGRAPRCPSRHGYRPFNARPATRPTLLLSVTGSDTPQVATSANHGPTCRQRWPHRPEIGLWCGESWPHLAPPRPAVPPATVSDPSAVRRQRQRKCAGSGSPAVAGASRVSSSFPVPPADDGAGGSRRQARSGLVDVGAVPRPGCGGLAGLPPPATPPRVLFASLCEEDPDNSDLLVSNVILREGLEEDYSISSTPPLKWPIV